MAAPVGQCAFALINGKQLLQCKLPAPSERTCRVDAEAFSDLDVMGDHGRFELSCLFYPSSDVTLEHRPWYGELLINEKHTMPLGTLPEIGQPRIVVRYVDVPQTLSLIVRVLTEPSYPHPDEEKLVEEIQLLLLARSTVGLSAPHENVVLASKLQAKLLPLALYQRVVGDHYGGRFLDFLLRQPELTIVQTPGGETQIAIPAPESVTPALRALAQISLEEPLPESQSSQDSSSNDSATSAPHVSSVEVERQTVECTAAVLEAGELSVHELLQHLVTSVPAWSRRLKASPSVLHRFLLNHPDIFWVKFDPMHSTRVGLRKNFETEESCDRSSEEK